MLLFLKRPCRHIPLLSESDPFPPPFAFLSRWAPSFSIMFFCIILFLFYFLKILRTHSATTRILSSSARRSRTDTLMSAILPLIATFAEVHFIFSSYFWFIYSAFIFFYLFVLYLSPPSCFHFFFLSFYSLLLFLEPIGVCGLVIPWNYPLLMAAWKIAPVIIF